MADCPKYRYTGSWTQDVLNVFSSDTRGQTPVLSEYVAFEVTANSFNFGPWASAEIHVEGVDELGDVRQSFEYTCATTDTYPKTFGANSLGGATIQLRYYIQVPTNQVGSAISWDFEIQFIGDCVALPPFYSQTEDQWGFAHVSNNWWQLAPAPAPLPPAPADWISAIACDPENPDKLYAVWVDDKYVRRSTDAGVTWDSVLFPAPETTPRPTVFRLCVRPGGQIFLLNSRLTDPTRCGIWRSVDNGVNWTRVVPFPDTASGYMDTSSTKLWYMKTAPATFYRANHDGTGIETLGTSATTGSKHIVHALDDELCLFTDFIVQRIWRVTSAGATDIRPADLRPWDAVPLSASIFIAVGTPAAGGNNVLVYRTTNAGTDWTLVKTITALEGFAQHGAVNSYYMIDAVAPARTDLVMTGHADQTVQQMFWVSTDAGLTWTKILNEAVPVVDGFWTVYGPGGVVARPQVAPLVAIPSRLATIVG